MINTTEIDKAISLFAYAADALMAYRRIIKSGDCNNCGKKDCQYKPEFGALVRYNCPFYEAQAGKKSEG